MTGLRRRLPVGALGDRAGRRLRRDLNNRIVVICAGAVALAACSPGSSPRPSTKPRSCTEGVSFNPKGFDPCWLAANVNAAGTPVYGGTLKIEGIEDVSTLFDPQGEYELRGSTLERVLTRQLVSYPASSDLATADSIVPDAATALPTVSADGQTYTFRIRRGVMWNTSPPRQVTSQDFKRGIDRTCDPTLAPDGNPSYYTATIAGFQAFCTPFETMDSASSPSTRTAYIDSHDVSGIQTPNSSTIIFTLTQPATDFLNILALPFASAAPVEDLSYVPVTPGDPFYSDGPYQISTYEAGHEIDLDRNPAWSQSTDIIRHDYVNNIDIKVDLAGSGVAQEVQDDLTTGATDLEWDTLVPTGDIGGLTSPAWNAQYGAFPSQGETANYLLFNVQSPNNNGALSNVKVRRALEYAINKVALNGVSGGLSLNQPLNQVIGPGAEGYVPFNDYPTKDDEGDPSKCKSLLAKAGYPNGLTLKDIYIGNPGPVLVYQEMLSDFGKCGVTVAGIAVHSGFYGTAGIGVDKADGLKAGKWDIAVAGWTPDWFGANGRAILPDLFDGVLSFPGTDFGGYDDSAVDTLVTNAEAALTLKQAASDWHQADERVMADAAFIPVETTLNPLFRSARVHNAIYFPLSQAYDISQIWLRQRSGEQV